MFFTVKNSENLRHSCRFQIVPRGTICRSTVLPAKTALSHPKTLSSHSSTKHASEIATLDTQKFRIAKSANDLEIESERLSSQLADLQARLQELELQGVDGGDNARRGLIDDEISLKLKVFRGLGIDIEKDESGEYNKVVIRNGRKGDVHIVNLDGKFSRFFYANYFWSML